MKNHVEGYLQSHVNMITRTALENGRSGALPELIRDQAANCAEALQTTDIMSYNELMRLEGKGTSGRLRQQRRNRTSRSNVPVEIVSRLVHDVLQTADSNAKASLDSNSSPHYFSARAVHRQVLKTTILTPSEDDVTEAIEHLLKENLILSRWNSSVGPRAPELERRQLSLTEKGRSTATFTNIADPDQYAQVTTRFEATQQKLLCQLMASLSPQLLETTQAGDLGPHEEGVDWINKASTVTLPRPAAEEVYRLVTRAVRILQEQGAPGRQGEPGTVDVFVRVFGKISAPGRLMPGEDLKPVAEAASSNDRHRRLGALAMLVLVLFGCSLFASWHAAVLPRPTRLSGVGAEMSGTVRLQIAPFQCKDRHMEVGNTPAETVPSGAVIEDSSLQAWDRTTSGRHYLAQDHLRSSFPAAYRSIPTFPAPAPLLARAQDLLTQDHLLAQDHLYVSGPAPSVLLAQGILRSEPRAAT